MTHILDPVYFKKIMEADPDDVCRRSLASYDREKRSFIITFLEERYAVNPDKREVLGPVREGPVSVELSLLILVYLLEAKDIQLEERWVGENNLKGGAMFFRGPHAIPNDALAGRFEQDINGFKSACASLGGKAVQTAADSSYHFQLLPRIPVLVSFWYGDEEFDASAKLLMDPTIEQHLPLDVIFGMALELYGRITGWKLWG